VHLNFESSVHSAFVEIHEALSAREKKLIEDSKKIQINKGACLSLSKN
jgi:hypothetical protein